MVHVSTHVLLTVLAISPAFAAPLAQQFEEEQFARDAEPEFEARDSSDSLDAREPISPALWSFGKKAFTAFAAGGSLGAVMGPLFKKKDGAKKRSFLDEDEFDARDFVGEDDLLEARKLLTSSKMLKMLPFLGGIGASIGAFGGSKASTSSDNGKRSFEEDLDARDFADDAEYIVARNPEDGSFDIYTRDPLNAGGLLKIGTTIGKAIGAVGRHAKWAFPALAAGGFAAGASARVKSMRSFEEDLDARDLDETEYYVVRSEDGSLGIYARSPLSGAGLLKIGTTIGKAAKWAFPALAAGGFAAGAAARVKSRSFEDDLDAREFDDELEYVSRYFDEDLMEVREFESLEELD